MLCLSKIPGFLVVSGLSVCVGGGARILKNYLVQRPDLPWTCCVTSIDARADSDQLVGGGRRLPRCRRGGGGKTGSAFDHLRREGQQIQDQDEEDRDDEMDAADLKPSIENPTWLGPLEAFDLCGGGFINPSINRYLKGYQREGVSGSKQGGGGGGRETWTRFPVMFFLVCVYCHAVPYVHFRRESLLFFLVKGIKG